MLHNCHYLHSIIALTNDTGQHVISKVIVTTDLAILRGNSDMRFVNLERTWFYGSFVFELVFLCLRVNNFNNCLGLTEIIEEYKPLDAADSKDIAYS